MPPLLAGFPAQLGDRVKPITPLTGSSGHAYSIQPTAHGSIRDGSDYRAFTYPGSLQPSLSYYSHSSRSSFRSLYWATGVKSTENCQEIRASVSVLGYHRSLPQGLHPVARSGLQPRCFPARP